MSAAVGGVVQQAVLVTLDAPCLSRPGHSSVTLVLPVSLARDTPPSPSCSLSLSPGTHLGLRGLTACDGRHHVTPSAVDRENTW